MQPPLQLEESFFDVLNVEAVREHKPPAPGEPQKHDITVGLELATIDDNPGMWQVTLDIRGNDEQAAPPPYRFRLRGVGAFRYMGDDKPHDDVAKVIGVNGASIVYSAAREYLLLVTSRGPWGPLTLPTMSFADFNVTAPDAEE